MSEDIARVAGNIAALNALNSLAYINNELSMHQTRLATGKRINYSYEDPAGLNIATTFDVRRQGLKVAIDAIGGSKNMLATAEGGLRKIQDILVKMKTKAMEAIGDTVGQDERNAVQAQLTSYAEEIDAIAAGTQWNGGNLISGSSYAAMKYTRSLSFLVNPDGGSVGFSFSGAATGSARSFVVGTSLNQIGFSTTSLTGASSSDVATRTAVSGSISAALENVKKGVREVGSFMARLTFKEDALTVQYINTEAAYNRIMNANMAEEQVEASKFMILQQTAVAMLAQANVAPQFLLTLFR